MPININENNYVCRNKARNGFIPFWVKDLDIDEQKNTIVVHFNSEQAYTRLCETIEGHNNASQTDEARPNSYSTAEDSELNLIRFIGNIKDALHFIRFHQAISEDTYQRSIIYLDNLTQNKELNKLDENKESYRNCSISTFHSSLNMTSLLFRKPKISASESKDNTYQEKKCSL